MVTATDVGLLGLRLGFGLAAAAHGAQKLFGWFGGHGLQGTAGFFDSVGFTPGDRNALVSGLVETGAGVAVAAGLATGPAGAALAGNMAVASSLHGFEKFFGQDGGPEQPLSYGVVGLVLSVTGAGALSLDAVTRTVFDRPWLRGVALVGAAAGAAAVIATRRRELARRAVSAGPSDPSQSSEAAAEASDPSI